MDDRLQIISSENGLALPLSLMFLMILSIVGSTAAMLTTTDLKIGANYKSSERAMYAAEAGIEEARARMKMAATGFINDAHPSQTQWSAFIGTEVKASRKGYSSSNAMHSRTTSLQTALDYSVRISHQTDASGNLLYYGDSDGNGSNERNTTSGRNIYLISSTGNFAAAVRTIEAETSRIPPINTPAALYVEAFTTIQGNTNVFGTDSCGVSDLPGIVTTEPPGSVSIHGSSAVISGADGTLPNVSYSAPDLDVQALADSFKGFADHTYTVNSETHTGTTTPGPGDGWGTPWPGMTLQDPSSCSESNVVYYDTGGTDIRLTGGVTGCGILLVEGDLEIHGGFSWYGIVITTGSVVYTGGGDKNITGTLIAGGSADGDIIGGNSNIIYCSSAVTDQTEGRALKLLSWKEDM